MTMQVYEGRCGTHALTRAGGGHFYCTAYFDLPRVFSGRSQTYFGPFYRQQSGKALTPLDQHNCVAVEYLIQAERCHLVLAIQAIKIDVINAGAVFVDQGEGWTGDLVGLRR